MIRTLREGEWLQHYNKGMCTFVSLKSLSDYFSADFRKRMLSLLAYQFREFSPSLALALLQNKHSKSSEGAKLSINFATNFDLSQIFDHDVVPI